MASRYDGRSDVPTITRRRHVLACARCRARRVKCDRGQPACSNCVKVGALCQPVQQSASQHAPLPSRSGSGEPVDRNRLYKLEEQVARLSREADSKSPSREPSHSPSPIDAAESPFSVRQTGAVKGGGSTYLSPFSWAAAAEEIVQLEAVLGEGVGEHGGQSARDAVNQNALPMVDDRMHEMLLGLFGQRIDPIVRVLHWPSFLDRCRKFRQGNIPHVQTGMAPSYPGAYTEPSPVTAYANQPNLLSQRGIPAKDTPEPASIGSAFVALLYSVYFAAMMAAQQSATPLDLGPNINPASLCSSFKKEISTRMGQVQGNYARVESIEMVQAIVIYMSMEIGASDPQLQWLQLGTAIRMAQSLGLHRDPVDFGFDPVEIETRRRLWAQICILDTRLAEHLCREPSIAPASYDTILPLSVSDQHLADINQQRETCGAGREMRFQLLQELEESQEHISPFSPMTFMLIEAEMAREQQQLLCFQYQPRDRAASATRRTTQPSGRTDRSQSANELHNRFSIRYNWDRLNRSDPLQHLVSELCQINLMKFQFVNGSSQRRAAMGVTSAPNDHAEVSSMFHEALQIATRCVALSHQYSNSPFNWYTKRIREVYSSSFLAMILASDRPISNDDTNAAWAVLNQLFSVDANGNTLDSGVKDTLLGRVLERARIKRGLQLHTPVVQQQSMHTPTGNYSSQLLPHPAVCLAASSQHTISTSGNLFEDWDALMQENVWPGGIPGTETNYWSTTALAANPSPDTPTPTPHPSRPYDQRPYDPPEQASYQHNVLPTPPILLFQRKSHPPSRLLPSLDMDLEFRPRRTSPLPSPYGNGPASATTVLGTITHWTPTPTPSSTTFALPPTPSRTYTAPQLNHNQLGGLQVPRANGRERSSSQPLSYTGGAAGVDAAVLKRRSASNLGERPEDLGALVDGGLGRGWRG